MAQARKGSRIRGSNAISGGHEGVWGQRTEQNQRNKVGDTGGCVREERKAERSA